MIIAINIFYILIFSYLLKSILIFKQYYAQCMYVCTYMYLGMRVKNKNKKKYTYVK